MTTSTSLSAALARCSGRLRPRALAVLVLLAPAVAAGAQDAERDVRRVFDRYQAAVVAADGEATLAAVDRRTVAYYGTMVGLALDADSATVAALPFMDRLMVLSLRHRVPADTLRAFDGARAFAYGVAHGWTDQGAAARQSLGGVRVAGDSASADLLLNGVAVPGVAFGFVREEGWRLDLTSVLDASAPAMRAAVEEMGETEDGFIVFALRALTGRAPGPELWRPVGRP